MKKPEIVLSINPTYYCNMSCSWCYLTPAQLSDRNRVDLSVLRDRLEEISESYQIEHVDVYGGEVTLLPRETQRDLIDMIEEFDPRTISITTNFTAPNAPILTEYDVDISVSYDHVARPNHEDVYQNLLMYGNGTTVLTLVSREFLNKVDIDEFVKAMSMLSIRSVELKPYSSNQANNHGVLYTEFERVVNVIMDHPDRDFHLTNIDHIERALVGENNAYSDNHLYITPKGDMAVLDFDEDDNEYFRKVHDIDEYHEWTRREVRITDEGMCGTCKYRGKCLSEHIRVVKDLDNSCNGFFNLLENYNDQ